MAIGASIWVGVVQLALLRMCGPILGVSGAPGSSGKTLNYVRIDNLLRSHSARENGTPVLRVPALWLFSAGAETKHDGQLLRLAQGKLHTWLTGQS
jgi:hypothetical protein